MLVRHHSPCSRLACVVGVVVLGLCMTQASYADLVTDIKVTNNTGLWADDLEMSFAGTGGISDATIVVNPATAGAAAISFAGNGITIDWAAPGLMTGTTIEFTIASASWPPDLEVLSAIWTFKNNQNNGTNDPIPVPTKDIVLKAVPEPSTLLMSGLGLAAVVGRFARRRRVAIR